jgi:hypothetical protein
VDAEYFICFLVGVTCGNGMRKPLTIDSLLFGDLLVDLLAYWNMKFGSGMGLANWRVVPSCLTEFLVGEE